MHDDDIDHIQAFYHEHRQALYTYALSLVGCRSTAEDVLHTVFAEILKRKALPNEIKPYMYRCIRNRSIDALRKRKHHQEYESFIEPDTFPSNADTRMIIEEALNTLSHDERETIVMKNFTGLTFEEIANLRSISKNTAASWYRRGLEKMRKLLEEVPNG